jgi:hypothetical protein
MYILDADSCGNSSLYGSDKSGSFAYGSNKGLIHVNDGDTVNIYLSQTVIAFTNLPGVRDTDIAVLITFNGVTTREAYAGDQRRGTISYTLKSTDNLQIKAGWWGPGINFPPMSGMLDPINFSIKETINSIYDTNTQVDGNGYLTTIPAEYITETQLAANNYTKTQIDNNVYTTTQIDTDIYTKTQIDNKGYLTSIPAEYITETELAANNYTKTYIDTNHYTKTYIDRNHYTKPQI